MNLPTFILKNTRRNKLRTILTVAGVMVAVTMFAILRTIIDAWYIGVEGSASDRLVTRNLVSLVFPLPISYENRIRQIPGVTKVAAGNWFGGIYIEEKNFFANFAVEAEPFLDLYPEFLIPPDQKKAFLADRTGCVVGDKLVTKYKWKLGDRITLKGTIFPDDMTFTIRAIYTGRDKVTDRTQMFFHWKYLNELMVKNKSSYRDQAGFYWVGISDPNRSPDIARAIDAQFKGTADETLTESEKAFQLGFISMASAIIKALQIVSGFVLVIIGLILGNTIAMAVRDRSAEISILKALGFSGRRLAMLIAGESALIGAVGGVVGIPLSMLLLWWFAKKVEESMGSLFPVFEFSPATKIAMFAIAIGMGLVAAIIPALRVARLRVVDALRQVG